MKKRSCSLCVQKLYSIIGSMVRFAKCAIKRNEYLTKLRTLRRKGELAGWEELGSSLEQGTCLSECLMFVHGWRSLTEVVLMEAWEMLSSTSTKFR